MKHLLKYYKNYKKEVILSPLFKLLEALLELFVPFVISDIVDNGIGNNDIKYIISRIIILIGIGLVGLLFSIIGQYFAAKAAIGFSKNIRKDLFEKIQGLSFSDIDALGVSTMITRMTNDVNQLQTGINLFLRLILRSPFVVFGAAIMATILKPDVAYIFWIAIPVLSIVIFSIMIFSINGNKKVQSNVDNVLNKTRENLTGVRVIRAFASESEEMAAFDDATLRLEKIQNKVGNLSNLMNPLTYIIINIATVCLLFVCFDLNLISGMVVALYNYMSQILVELIKLANLIITLTKSVASANRIGSVLDINNETVITSSTGVDKPYICYDKVSLKYNFAGKESLEDISFSVNKGDTIGIIGGTGSGKTSLVHLLARFYEVSSGMIYFDNKEITEYDPVILRDKIGIVMQKAILFQGTIRENLMWGNDKATDEELLKACEIAQCLDIINKKENGLDSIVEQGGKNFSGGQRQRLSIARAIVKKPEILILDDSASALDYATDAALRKAIKELDYNPTVFIVSQRTASIQNATNIVVLDEGKLVGFGTHDELLENNSVYKEIYYSQFKKEDK